MPPGVAVGPASSIASGYAACSVINTSGPQDHQQKALLRGNYPENMDSHVMGIGSSSSSTSSTSSRSSSSSSGESAELSDKDQLQVQSCYKGLKTQVNDVGITRLKRKKSPLHNIRYHFRTTADRSPVFHATETYREGK